MYKRLFNIEELENSKLLQFLYYAVIFSFFVTFYGWISRDVGSISSIAQNTYICPPYFTSCYKLFFYQILPYGYSQSFFYVILYVILLYGALSAYKKDWVSAHKALLVTFSWKFIWVFFLSYSVAGNFDYYDMGFAFVLLFLQNKAYFAKLMFVWFYFLASTIKIHEGWIFGTYLTSLITGAPFFSNKLTPFFTNIVIVMQIVGSWFLFSKNKILQRLSFLYFSMFHIYSGILVNLRYIAISIPALYILFANDKHIDEDADKPFEVKKVDRSTVFGYTFMFSILAFQMIAYYIPGDQKKTLEGNYYGLYMFEANHQCISTATFYFKDGREPLVRTRENHLANNRCDAYRYYFALHNLCKDSSFNKISWTFDHSINGHKYERMVDEENVCTLTYSPLAHNKWIKMDREASTINTPVYKNGYGSGRDVIRFQVPSDSYENEDLAQKMSMFYWGLWILALVVVIFKVIKATYYDKRGK